MITTRALNKRYGAVTAVQDLDLDVREGDRYGLLGPNGSGKTTLVRMLLGLVYATSGEIEIMGQRIPRHVREVLPQIGALIEEPAAYPHLSGRANLALLDAAGPGGRSARRTRAKRTGEALEQVGLAGVGRRPIPARPTCSSASSTRWRRVRRAALPPGPAASSSARFVRPDRCG